VLKGAKTMAGCDEMKVGQVYMCEECGLELRVVKECTECAAEAECSCVDECEFECCGEPLKLKK
jgi:hypothetical protein